MKLKKIKLAGFKSFVDPTTVPFGVSLSAVVGPNGCGKSNIIDAVRWVLGESSAKNLRGDAMTDVIFNGSSARKPISQASVELVFDNTEGRVGGEFAAYNEISVKRQVNREAQSSYFLNNNKCRRRDITDLFLGTGLGPRSYAIIEQGMISKLIESRPQELRIFIEEAAGISKYKERRRETENRLRHTADNMDRLADVRQELNTQLEKLQRQASAAQRYKTLRAEERKTKAELTVLRWQAIQDKLQQLAANLEQCELKADGVDTQQQKLESEQVALQSTLETEQQHQQQQQQQLYQVGTQIARLEQEIHHAGQRRQQLQQDLAAVEQQHQEQQRFITEQEQHVQQYAAQSDELEQRQAMVEATLEQAELAAADAEQQLEQWQEQWQQLNHQQADERARVSQAETLLQQAQTQLTRLTQQQQQLSIRLEQLALPQMEQELAQINEQLDILHEQLEQHQAERLLYEETLQDAQANYQQQREQLLAGRAALGHLEQREQTVQRWLQQASAEQWPQWAEGQSSVQRLAEATDVNPDWASAVDMVLQGRGQGFAVATLPHETVAEGQAVYQWHNDVSVAPDSLAAQVQGPDGLRAVLADIYCVADIEQALQRLTTLPEHASVVTADGYWCGHGWLVRHGGQPGELALHNELAQVQQQLEQQRQQLAQQETRCAEDEQQLQQAKQQLQQHLDQAAGLQREREQGVQQQTRLVERYQLAQQQQQGWQQELATLDEEREQRALDIEVYQEQLLQLEEHMAQFQEQQQQQEQQRETLKAALADSRAQREQVKQTLQQLTIEQNRLKTEQHAAQQAGQRAQEQHQRLLQRRQQLTEEANALEQPGDVGREQLETLLAQRLEHEQLQREIAETITRLQDQLHTLQQQLKDLQQQKQGQQGQLESLRLEQESLKTRSQALVEQLAEQEVKLAEVIADMSETAAETLWQEELEKLGRSISRLGPINLAAIEEYESQSERKRYLDEQADDLQAAVETLEGAIRKIDRECRHRFKETFDRVNNDLQTLFPKVFGGGSASLELTDDDLLETGVSIMARPPGKRNATIHLLSGGEKALTALSLVFAIFRLNPAPFCMLDEVDAPLDDANVGRFCNLVREMSASVQFVYISHNKVTMEMADQLLGVTMHEPGVSRLVSVDVEQALALAEAS